MAHTYHEVQQTRHAQVTEEPAIVERQVVRDEGIPTDGTNLASRIVTLVAGIIVSLLALRFILSLMGANQNNGFANAVYNLSHPFVAPFFGLFNYHESLGVGRFEYETLIAILFWSLVAWGITRLLTINQHR
jgi:hypothetical protein